MKWRMERCKSVVGRWSVCLRGMDGGEDGFITGVLRKSTASFWPWWPLRSRTGHHGEISFLSDCLELLLRSHIKVSTSKLINKETGSQSRRRMLIRKEVPGLGPVMDFSSLR